MVPPERREEALTEAESLTSVEIGEVDLQWVQVLGEGWASPLKGQLFVYILSVISWMFSLP